ncbi:uncharacterized protein LOC143423805 [Xylocopa sonorina]|uniref:uncharacterized protein LOC143423805 n=1 Tax=Xylocopa sonorina TaxID=1818115 RepID=UPI00403ADAFB
MKGLLCFWFVCLIRCLAWIKCTIVFVAASDGSPTSDDWRESWKLLRQPVNVELREEWGDYQRPVNANFFRKFSDLSDEGIVLFSTDKCSRYCIEKSVDQNGDNFQYINLFWTANGVDVTGHPEKNHPQLLGDAEPSNPRTTNINPQNCQIYLDLDCNIVDVETTTGYARKRFHSNMENSKENENVFNKSTNSDLKIPIKIAEKYNLSKQTQTKFTVNNTVHRIIIDIDGNVSSVLLQMPVDATAPSHGTAMSWVRKGAADGVRIDTRNAPSGEWRMKLLGEDDSKYRLFVEAFVGVNDARKLFFPDPWLKENSNDEAIAKYYSNIQIKDNVALGDKMYNDDAKNDSEVIAIEQQNLDAPATAELAENIELIREKPFKRHSKDTEGDNRVKEEKSSIVSSNTEVVPVNFVEYITFTTANKTVSISTNVSNEKSFGKVSLAEEQGRHRTKSPTGSIENFDVEIDASTHKTINISTRMIETLDDRQFSEEMLSYVNQNVEEKKMLIEVNRDSNLLVTPGTIHRVVFDVLNNCVLPVRYAFRVKSTPFSVYNVQPQYAWIYPGQMSNVAIDLIVPKNAAPDTANTVTLFILGTEIKEKSVYLYVQGSLSKLTDDVKPTVEYSFNNNCAGKLAKDQCYKSSWSVDIKIQDYDSGLKRVITSTNNIYPRTEFISGTRSPLTFYYSATCCDKTVKITAIDLLDNYNSVTIDVTAWNNLSEAEIATITVGTLFVLLLIVLVVILIAYCVRRRKSHDLPYTQRYGSRPPAQSERTNF